MNVTKIVVRKIKGYLGGYIGELVFESGFVIDWGDGAVTINEAKHVYQSEGIYEITVSSKLKYSVLTYCSYIH